MRAASTQVWRDGPRKGGKAPSPSLPAPEREDDARPRKRRHAHPGRGSCRLDALDKRTVAGRLLYDAKQDFTAHVGGEDEASATETALIERLAMRKLTLALVDEMFLK